MSTRESIYEELKEMFEDEDREELERIQEEKEQASYERWKERDMADKAP